MSLVKPLIGFGLAIFAAGLLWKMYDDVINELIIGFVSNTSDKYYLMSDVLWNSLPFVVMFVGIICLVLGGVSHASNSSEGGN